MCIGGPKLLRQGRAKAASRPSQGRAKAASRPRQGATRKKRTTDAPKGSPELILELLVAILVDFWDCIVQLQIFMFFFRILRNLRLIFTGINLPRPRFLQYLTEKLKVFAYCSESLRKRVRGLQNGPKLSPETPLGAYERPLELQVGPKKPVRGT